MPLEQPHLESLEKAGGLILEQLVAAQAITTEQQSAILEQQRQAEQQTGQKPYVGELLERNGIDTSAIKQPLLDLQATARTLLYAHGKVENAQRCEGRSGEINLQEGVPDNKWTLQDMKSGDPAREQTALLQTRLLQTKVLITAVSALHKNGHSVPESSISALHAVQDNARATLGTITQTLREAGQSPDALEAAYASLPTPMRTVSQEEIHAGVSNAIQQLQQSGMLTEQQAQTLLGQEEQRSANINELQRDQARYASTSKSDDTQSPESPPSLGSFTERVRSERTAPPSTGTGRGA